MKGLYIFWRKYDIYKLQNNFIIYLILFFSISKKNLFLLAKKLQLTPIFIFKYKQKIMM